MVERRVTEEKSCSNNFCRVITMSKVSVSVILVLWLIDWSNALNNGLALTPPMGFNTWERYRCTIDCTVFPEGCINEKLIKKIADQMASDGYLEAGYEYLVIDDCWLAHERSRGGKLQADESRFPNGMKALVDYVHGKGLKFGIYENWGERTCAGFPGVKDFPKVDAELFAKDWGVDFVKLDGCFSDHKAKAKGYPEFGRYLNESGKPIVYSCSWPSYLVEQAIRPNYTAIAETCNLWRNYEDVEDSWASVLDIIEYYGKEQDSLQRFHGPGHWHDADMLIIGNFGLSYEQSKSQMAIWCVMGVPLFLSADLTKMRPELKKILLNELAIQINQDPLGYFGRRISHKNGIQVWRRAVLPENQSYYYSYAIAILNSRKQGGSPLLVTRTLEQLGLYNPHGYMVEDVFQGLCATVKQGQSITSKIPPSGVAFWKFTVLTDESLEPPCLKRNKRPIKSVRPYYVYTVGLIYVLGIGSLSAMFWRARRSRRNFRRVIKV